MKAEHDKQVPRKISS